MLILKRYLREISWFCVFYLYSASLNWKSWVCLCFLMCCLFPEDHNISKEVLAGYGMGLHLFTMLTHWMKQDEMLIYLLQKSHWLGIVVKESWGWICKNEWCCMRYSHIDIIIRKWGAFYGTSWFCFRRVTTARHSQGTKSDLSQPI